jgi:NAD(P)-dependent dehydrogenase (short-subunit alcohol dehydrogenase family)
VAIITGASSGIGEAVAKLFASQGAKLVLNGRNAERLNVVAAAITDKVGAGKVVTVVGDVSDEAVHVKLVATAIEKFGGLHIACNLAAVYPFSPLPKITADKVNALVGTNVNGLVYALKHQMAAIAKYATKDDWGSIVNCSSSATASTSVGMASFGAGVYAATKGFTETLTKFASAEGAASFIRVNAVQPGATASAGAVAFMGGGNVDVFNAKAGAMILAGSTASTDEIAQFVLFVAANQTGRFFHGSVLMQDGGATIR